MKSFFYVVVILLILSSTYFAQLSKESKESKAGSIQRTSAFEGDIKFTDGTNNLIRITDEGNFGAIQFLSGVPNNTNHKLYNDNGKLFFDGTEIKGVGIATDSLNHLLDVKFDGQSLFLGENSGLNDDGGASDGVKNFNLAVGKNSLNSNIDGVGNVAIGYSSLMLNQNGDYNTALGNSTLHDNTTGNNNTAIGNQAMYSNIDGEGNVALGKEALFKNSGGEFNTAIGLSALTENENGGLNTAIGAFAGKLVKTGSFNTYIGMYSGYNNLSGNSNVYIGYRAGENAVGNNQLYIENSPFDDPLIWGDFLSNRIVINGNSTSGNSNYNLYVNGDAGGSNPWNNLSDIRLKKDISTIPDALHKVKSLRGVNFSWKDQEKFSEGKQIGFIAQEAVEVIPELVDTDDEYHSMQYAPITALLVEAVKEQQVIIENLKNHNSDLEKRLINLENLLLEGKYSNTNK